MASHSSVLAWRIPGRGEPGGLLSMGSHRVRHNGSDLAAAAASHSQESSPAPRFKSVHSLVPSLLYGLTLTSIHDYWKAIAFTIWTFESKVMSLIFNVVSSLVIAFLSRSKHLLISWLQSPSAVILEPPKIKSHCFHCFPIYLP